MTKTLPLSQGKVALIDDEDAERPEIGLQKWSATKHGGRWYAKRATPRPDHRHLYLHRVVLGLPPNFPDVDHVNGDGLDCRKENLRTATRSQNLTNSGSRGGTSRFRGVSWDKRRHQWIAFIGGHNKKFLGRFDIEEDAAEAYDAAALADYGEFARTNKREGKIG